MPFIMHGTQSMCGGGSGVVERVISPNLFFYIQTDEWYIDRRRCDFI